MPQGPSGIRRTQPVGGTACRELLARTATTREISRILHHPPVMQIVEQLVQVAAPFAKIYNHSKVLEIGTTYLHIASMLGAGGLAISADRSSLTIVGSDRENVARHVADQRALHRWVVGGLVL
ncbi:MAG: hypothetical protein HY275_15035, partial [Gemmatimonadetes bacterium]|nr:hypothetical protein [Gemmatimonadota bacterium]